MSRRPQLSIARTQSKVSQLEGPLADLFQAFADTTRLKILVELLCTPMCVHEIATAIELEQSSVSHQLRKLRMQRLVRSERKGKHVYYEIDDNHVRLILEAAIDHLDH